MSIKTNIFLLMLTFPTFCFGTQLPDTLFDIQLASNIDSLKGNHSRQIGIVTIKGIKHERYIIDKAVYSPISPLNQIMVSVEKKSQQIVSISGFTEIKPEQCQEKANKLMKQVETFHDIKFVVIKHQGSSFYVHETKDKFISVGCQVKRKTMLQYQLGRKSS